METATTETRQIFMITRMTGGIGTTRDASPEAWWLLKKLRSGPDSGSSGVIPPLCVSGFWRMGQQQWRRHPQKRFWRRLRRYIIIILLESFGSRGATRSKDFVCPPQQGYIVLCWWRKHIMLVKAYSSSGCGGVRG